MKGVPVIVISARAEVEDKVALLSNGAADYVTKPFAIPELLARIAVQLRKTHVIDSALQLKYDDILLDETVRGVFVGEREVRLTRTEYAILRMLMRNPAQVITKSTLLDGICEDTPDCMEISLKVHISNLRRKLREVSGRDYIESVWGIGFKMKSTS